MKKLRKRFGPTRFYMCGEYGEQTWRPHYHAILFGLRFPDLKYYAKGPGGFAVYTSQLLTGLWARGHAVVGDMTFASAAYCARYVMKKVNGDMAADHYRCVDAESGEVFQRVPEFSHMSLKPGIGARFLEKFRTDMYPHGRVVVNGHESMPPRYYDKRFARQFEEEFESLKFQRELIARERWEDNTLGRLLVKEQVVSAQVGLLKRSI
jgi:hypothetical protein